MQTVNLKQQSIRTKMNGSLKEEGRHYLHFTAPPKVDKFHFVEGKFYICEDKACGFCSWSNTAFATNSRELAMQYKARWRLYAHGIIDDYEVPIFLSWHNLGIELERLAGDYESHDAADYDFVIKTTSRDMGKFYFPKYEIIRLDPREVEYEKENDFYFAMANSALTDDETVEFTKKLLL